MIRPKLYPVQSGTILTANLVNDIINRTEYAADLLRQYKLIAGTKMYVEPRYDGTRISFFKPVKGGAGASESGGVPISITWSTGTMACNLNPWTISQGGRRIRIDAADSANCGGGCIANQSSVAFGTIVTQNNNLNMRIAIAGNVEYESSLFDTLNIRLAGPGYSNQTVASGTGVNAGLGCVMGAPTVTYPVAQPLPLNKLSTYTIRVDFNTQDNRFHVNLFYETLLSFFLR